MRKKMVLITVGLTLICALGLVLVNQATTSAQECRVIRVYGLKGGTAKLTIEPPALLISKGTCVVWTNWVRAEEVTVTFEDGKKCDDVTDAAVGFTMTAANCYVSSWIPLGGTSSLRFNEAGTFDYVVESRGKVKAVGKIIVE